MTDRELLEAAARAAGMDVFGADKHGNLCVDPVAYVPWNPLDVDSDAFDLLISSKLQLEFDMLANEEHIAIVSDLDGRIAIVSGDADDFKAATRRAITRAAAALAQTPST